MADADSTQATPAPAAAPVVEAAPVAAAPVTPAPVAAPVEAPAAPVAAAPVTETAKPAEAAAPSLLSAEPEAAPVEAPKTEAPTDIKPEAKPADTKAEPTADKPAEVTDTTPLPTYEPFKLPEGMTANETTADFTKNLAEFEASKPDHAKFQEFGQKLLDQHTAIVQKALTDQTDYFIQLNERQKASDLEALRKDPLIGKGGDAEAFQAFGKDFVNFIAKNGGTKEEVTAFREFTKERGVDNALPIIRVINNLKNKIERYESESAKILPGTKPAVAAPAHPGKGMTGRLYGGK